MNDHWKTTDLPDQGEPAPLETLEDAWEYWRQRADRMQTTLQLIASLRCFKDDACNTIQLASAITAAQSALAEQDDDPMCEVLR